MIFYTSVIIVERELPFGKVLELIDPDTYKEYVMEKYKNSSPTLQEPEFKF